MITVATTSSVASSSPRDVVDDEHEDSSFADTCRCCTRIHLIKTIFFLVLLCLLTGVGWTLTSTRDQRDSSTPSEDQRDSSTHSEDQRDSSTPSQDQGDSSTPSESSSQPQQLDADPTTRLALPKQLLPSTIGLVMERTGDYLTIWSTTAVQMPLFWHRDDGNWTRLSELPWQPSPRERHQPLRVYTAGGTDTQLPLTVAVAIIGIRQFSDTTYLRVWEYHVPENDNSKNGNTTTNRSQRRCMAAVGHGHGLLHLQRQYYECPKGLRRIRER